MKKKNQQNKRLSRILIGEEFHSSQTLMYIPNEKSLPTAAAATMHKATAVCETDRQTKQVNLRQILNLPQIMVQANTRASTQ